MGIFVVGFVASFVAFIRSVGYSSLVSEYLPGDASHHPVLRVSLEEGYRALDGIRQSHRRRRARHREPNQPTQRTPDGPPRRVERSNDLFHLAVPSPTPAVDSNSAASCRVPWPDLIERARRGRVRVGLLVVSRDAVAHVRRAD